MRNSEFGIRNEGNGENVKRVTGSVLGYLRSAPLRGDSSLITHHSSLASTRNAQRVTCNAQRETCNAKRGTLMHMSTA